MHISLLPDIKCTCEDNSNVYTLQEKMKTYFTFLWLTQKLLYKLSLEYHNTMIEYVCQNKQKKFSSEQYSYTLHSTLQKQFTVNLTTIHICHHKRITTFVQTIHQARNMYIKR